jgi:putative ABC transport system permease protein
MSHLKGDARFALRTLLKRPSASLLLVATLALGLAANAVIFNVLDAVVLRAFAFPNQERLVRVHETSRDFEGIDLSNVAPANLLDWQAQAGGVFSDLVGLQWWDASLRGRDASERVQGYRVGPSFFDALGVAPAQGRGFLAEEAREGQDRRAVLGHALWQRAFGGEPVVGQTVIVDSEPFNVVGIAPPGFQFPEGAELWAPLVLPDPAAAARDRHYLSVMGKLAQGRTREEARAALAVVAARLSREHPKTNASRGVAVPSFRAGFADPVLPQILVIWQAAAVLVLLIACVNVANLILAQSAERGRELALRLALGAGPGRVARQLLTEGVLVALLAAGLAMPLLALAARVLRESMPAEIARFVPGWQQLGADWRGLLFSAVVAVLAAAAFSAIPAWRAARLDLSATLREGGRAATAGGRRQLGRDVLVVGQLTAALALLVVAGDAVRSARALLDGPQGYEPRGVLAFEVTLAEARYSDPHKQRAFVRDVEARLAELPGVESVAVSNTLPGRGGYSSRPVAIEGQPLAEGAEPPQAEARVATPALFATLKLPLVQGRGLESVDKEDARHVAVVSRSFAERFWPGQDPLGKRFRMASGDADAPWLAVVGVSGDVVHHWLLRRNAPTFYRPFAQAPTRHLSFALRASGDPEALAAPVRRALAAVDPDQPAYQLRSLPRSIRQSTIGLQYIAGIMAAFGVLALVLAVGGVYGVMSYRVSRRTLEIGVRVALGASRGDVLRLTLGQALRLAAVGLLLGSGLGWAASRALGSTLRGAVTFEPVVLAGVVALLGSAALLAAWIPARRALGIDPARALRAE